MLYFCRWIIVLGIDGFGVDWVFVDMMDMVLLLKCFGCVCMCCEVGFEFGEVGGFVGIGVC